MAFSLFVWVEPNSNDPTSLRNICLQQQGLPPPPPPFFEGGCRHDMVIQANVHDDINVTLVVLAIRRPSSNALLLTTCFWLLLLTRPSRPFWGRPFLKFPSNWCAAAGINNDWGHCQSGLEWGRMRLPLYIQNKRIIWNRIGKWWPDSRRSHFELLQRLVLLSVCLCWASQICHGIRQSSSGTDACVTPVIAQQKIISSHSAALELISTPIKPSGYDDWGGKKKENLCLMYVHESAHGNGSFRFSLSAEIL